MEKLNLSVSLRLTTQRGIFLQNHFLRPTLSSINITAILDEFMYVLSKNLQTSYNVIWKSRCNDLMSIISPGDWDFCCDGGGGGGGGIL